MSLTEVLRDGSRRPVTRSWVPEAAVALEYNGLAYAVMMATPRDLKDFATGFAISEGLAASAGAVSDIVVTEVADGWVVRARISDADAERLASRARARVAESSCGLCGIDNLAALARPLPPVAAHAPIAPVAIFAALANLTPLQALGRETAAAHAAAQADRTGAIGWLREDVGRHNAVDKLIGACARAGASLADGFVLSTARCSYEIVEKAVRAGATTLVTISLPTTLAVARAKATGLSLWVRARDDAVLLAHDASAAG